MSRRPHLPPELARALARGPKRRIRAGSQLGKYKLRRRLATGGFADVYLALDTVQTMPVALKIPHEVGESNLGDFLREIQMMSALDHPNILRVLNADVMEGRLLVAYQVGVESLDERLTRRISINNALELAEQMLAGLAHAHEHRIVHCDVKPDNLILFEDGTLKLGDFGLAKLAVRSIYGSSSGTLGYMAPEHAMGRPSARSDVFSAGLVIYRMVSGKLPEWPFEAPLPGHERVRRHGPELVHFLRRAIAINARDRYADAGTMLRALVAVRRRLARR